jgi:hypothetical protein
LQGTGIGPALRKARLLQGKSIEEASRETRIRADYLHALERERFEALLGEVYVRGCLRSYSSYLGVDADKVLTIYNRHFGAPSLSLADPPLPTRAGPTGAGRGHPHIPEAVRRHPSWTVLAVAAVIVLGVFAASGLLSRSRSAPPPATLGQRPGAGAQAGGVTLAIRAIEAVDVEVRTDGQAAQQFSLRPEETRTFQGASTITVQLSRGGVAELIVDGRSTGTPGRPSQPYQKTFGPQPPSGSGSPPSPSGH